eukprot:CAMPEP_0118866548 /NCGR_PEP_ID=MMETSP1163-20130328/10424_1 /TAXON_ID=124430 /ORGANISM="Phaeomonas parva, Strain CCMP2877" /LENGTH=33 /DNA_ID= /DNA_START= /DNA_END= /DNA_ORIENTATION=
MTDTSKPWVRVRARVSAGRRAASPASATGRTAG